MRNLAAELEALVARTFEEGDADAEEFAEIVGDFIKDLGKRPNAARERRRKDILRRAQRILRDIMAGRGAYGDYLASARDVGRRVSEKTFFVGELLAILGDEDRKSLREVVKLLAARPLAPTEKAFVRDLLKAKNLNAYASRVERARHASDDGRTAKGSAAEYEITPLQAMDIIAKAHGWSGYPRVSSKPA